MPPVPRPRREFGKISVPGDPAADVVWLCDDARGIRAAVVPSQGGELGGLQVKTGGRWKEILYRGMDYLSEPPYRWRGRAPLLWPAVGRSYTRDQHALWRKSGRGPRHCQVSFGGHIYPMPMHGFVMTMPWRLVGSGEAGSGAWARCALHSSAETREMYPFDWSLAVTHRLDKGGLTSRYEVTAGGNAGPMPFCIGNHIGFQLPLGEEGSFGKCCIRTPARVNHLLSDVGVLSGRTKRVDLAKPAPLSTGLYKDTFLGGYRRHSAWAEVMDPTGFTIHISQAEIPVAGRRLSKERSLHYVIWGKRYYSFVCPEPWLGRPNALNTGDSVIRLAPGKKFVWEMRIAVLGR